MIGYVMVGTNDMERAARFYDAIAAELGSGRLMELERAIIWGKPGGASIAATLPFDGQPASVGNGSMVALAARDAEQVNRLHAIALAQGGSDEGAPGQRGTTYYGAYFRDPDGNKLNAFCMVAPASGEAN